MCCVFGLGGFGSGRGFLFFFLTIAMPFVMFSVTAGAHTATTCYRGGNSKKQQRVSCVSGTQGSSINTRRPGKGLPNDAVTSVVDRAGAAYAA